MAVVSISAVIITKNESENIARCIKSLNQVVEEVLVLDSESTDETVKISRELGARVVVKKWMGYAQSKNYANNLAANDWILSIDADEVLSNELIQEIRAIQLSPNTVYEVNRLNNFCGQWIRHSGWFPDWKVRLFNRQTTYWIGEYVHERLKFSEQTKIKRLQGLLFHYTYKTHADHLQRIEKYSSLSAAELFAKGSNPGWIKVWGGPAFRFLKTFILQRGFLDGKNGWIISKRAAYMVYLKYQKLKQLKNK